MLPVAREEGAKASFDPMLDERIMYQGVLRTII